MLMALLESMYMLVKVALESMLQMMQLLLKVVLESMPSPLEIVACIVVANGGKKQMQWRSDASCGIRFGACIM